MDCSTRARPTVIAVWFVLALIAGIAPAGAVGSFEIATPVAGTLHLEDAFGQTRAVSLAPGRTTVRDLPAGEYAAQFVAADHGGAEIPTAIFRIYEQSTVTFSIDPDARAIRASDRPAGARGAVLLLDENLLSALPGDSEAILRALDTRVRWRPSVRINGGIVVPAAERIALVPGGSGGPFAGTLGPSSMELSTAGAATRAAAWNLAFAPSLPSGVSAQQVLADRDVRPVFRAAGDLNNYEGREVSADLLLKRVPLAGRFVRGRTAIHYSDLNDAHPRSEADGVLPHNDASALDLAAHVEIGPEMPKWALRADVASRGWTRNHFEQIYRRNLAHAPYEETAFFAARAELSFTLGDRVTTEAFAGYDRYLTQFSDGRYKGDLSLYPQSGNGAADPSGLYWQGSSGEGLALPHVWDYLVRKYSSTWRTGLTLKPSQSMSPTFWRFDLQADRHVYRRYENFAPADPGAGPYRDALFIGYDESGEQRTDSPYPPGEPLTLRGSFELQRWLGATWRAEGSIGGFFMDSRDSSLVDLALPVGTDFILTADDFERAPRHFRPEGSLALRGRLSAKTEGWGLGYRRASLPPLEALFDPRAHLSVRSLEGIVGNPALAPEVESGVELGVSRPISLARFPARLTIAAYAARIDDALSLRYATFASSSGDTVFATLENDATLRQYGLHVALEHGEPADRVRALLSYDLSSTESDRFEPPLLDARWIYPDLAPGEYESEGYAGPLGGILDPFYTPDLESGGYRPSNLDRTHRMSLAVILTDSPPSLDAGWLTALARGWTFGALARLESGRAFTQTVLYPAGLTPNAEDELRGPEDPAWAEPVALRNGQRMDPTFEFDLALTRRLSLGNSRVLLGLTIFNILGITQTTQVYRSTGDAREDGCWDNDRCRGQLPDDTTEADYRARLLDPLRFGRPRILQLAVGLEIL